MDKFDRYILALILFLLSIASGAILVVVNSHSDAIQEIQHQLEAKDNE